MIKKTAGIGRTHLHGDGPRGSAIRLQRHDVGPGGPLELRDLVVKELQLNLLVYRTIEKSLVEVPGVRTDRRGVALAVAATFNPRARRLNSATSFVLCYELWAMSCGLLVTRIPRASARGRHYELRVTLRL